MNASGGWDHLHVLSFNFKLAFRRWKKAGARASVEGVEFKTFYYSPEKDLPHCEKGVEGGISTGFV